MKIGDVVVDLHGHECVVTAIDEKHQVATIYNLRPGMYNPRVCEIKDLRVLNDYRRSSKV